MSGEALISTPTPSPAMHVSLCLCVVGW